MMKKFPLMAALVLLALTVAGGARADAPAQPVSGKDAFATVFGLRIHYVEEGEGPVVILLHGLDDDIGVWQDTLKALSTKYRVIAYDQLGFGKSDKPIMAYRVATFVDFLDGFMKALKIDHASLAGNSMGGWVAIDFTLRYPQKVDRLILIDSAGYGDWPSPEVGNALRLATRADLRKLIPLTFFNSKAYETDAAIDEMFATHMATRDSFTILQLLDSGARGEDIIDGKVKKIVTPTLIVWGREDRLIPLSNGDRLHKDIRNSKLHIIENCGHMSQVECPEALNPLLLRFLETPSRSRP